jgi:hypothetical protein
MHCIFFLGGINHCYPDSCLTKSNALPSIYDIAGNPSLWFFCLPRVRVIESGKKRKVLF